MFRKKKIPCYVLVFDQFSIIKRSLDFLTAYADRLDIIVIENPSPATPEIQAYVDTLGKSRLIKRYYLFERNITSNAYKIVINREIESVRKSKFVIITDGDLVVEHGDWLKEEEMVLKQHPNVFACGVTLDMANLPIRAFPSANTWVPPDIAAHPDFFEAHTGGHLLLMRGTELAACVEWMNAQKHHFVDSDLHWYCHNVANKIWARTKETKAYHLTWDLYQDSNHPYTQLKTTKNHQDIWYHGIEADFSLTEY